MTITVLDNQLSDLQHELIDLRRVNIKRDYDINRLSTIISKSKDSLKETEISQHHLLKQLHLFELSLADINQILRGNAEQKAQLEQQQQQQTDNDIDIRAKLMALNAEALECRAAAVQLQQDVRIAIAKAAEVEKRANDELAQQELERKLREQEIERARVAEHEKRLRLEEERNRLKEIEIRQQQEKQLLEMAKSQEIDEYIDWPKQDFMRDDRHPQCIIRTSPDDVSMSIDIEYVGIAETENLLDPQEELISTPLKSNDSNIILISIPYIIKRSTYRENIIKIRQSDGTWISIDTTESIFDSYKDKRFVECKLDRSASCAVVSRLKHDTFSINKQSSGRFSSNADSRLTIQWPRYVCENDLSMKIRVQPIDLPLFAKFIKNFSHECNGLLGVGPILNLHFEEVNLRKPIQFTIPILNQGKKNATQNKSTIASEPNQVQSGTLNSTNQLSQQELILQQQQLIFKSVLGENSGKERIALFYSSHNEKTWYMEKNVEITESKAQDIIIANMQMLYDRMIVVRYDKQLISAKQLPNTLNLLEEVLNQRYVSLVLRHRSTNPNEICFVCCSSKRSDEVDKELQDDNYIDEDEQSKQLVLKEGQLLELRFRGNVLPNDYQNQSYPFAFNTNYPFFYQTNVFTADRYSQHFSPYYYGFAQIYSKQKVLRVITKETDKKKQQNETVKQEWQETDVCIAELVVRLQKPNEETRVPPQKTLPTFTSEGILTSALFRDMSASLIGDEWRRLGRRLGLTRIRLEAIEHDYHEDTAYFMLLAWFKRVPRSSDKVSILISSLVNINRWDLAQDLQTMREDKHQEQRLSSKDEQLKAFRMPFNWICQRDDCIRMWKRIARELMLTNDDIDHIEQRYSSKQERCLKSLEHWALNDIRADLPTLSRLIRSLGFKSLAREIDNLV